MLLYQRAVDSVDKGSSLNTNEPTAVARGFAERGWMNEVRVYVDNACIYYTRARYVWAATEAPKLVVHSLQTRADE